MAQEWIDSIVCLSPGAAAAPPRSYYIILYLLVLYLFAVCAASFHLCKTLLNLAEAYTIR